MGGPAAGCSVSKHHALQRGALISTRRSGWRSVALLACCCWRKRENGVRWRRNGEREDGPPIVCARARSLRLESCCCCCCCGSCCGCLSACLPASPSASGLSTDTVRGAAVVSNSCLCRGRKPTHTEVGCDGRRRLALVLPRPCPALHLHLRSWASVAFDQGREGKNSLLFFLPSLSSPPFPHHQQPTSPLPIHGQARRKNAAKMLPSLSSTPRSTSDPGDEDPWSRQDRMSLWVEGFRLSLDPFPAQHSSSIKDRVRPPSPLLAGGRHPPFSKYPQKNTHPRNARLACLLPSVSQQKTDSRASRTTGRD